MNGDGDFPVTRRELRRELEAFEARFEQKLDRKLDQKLEERFTEERGWFVEMIAASQRDLATMLRHEIGVEIARHTQAMAEMLRDEMRAMFDPLREIPDRVAFLERDLDAHRQDFTLHKRPRGRKR